MNRIPTPSPWDDFDDNSLEFVFKESCKMLDETLKAFRETTRNTAIVLTAYLGGIVYALNEIMKLFESRILNVNCILFFGLILAGGWVIQNLFTTTMNYPGILPEKLLTDYFRHEEVKKQQYRQILITRVEHQNNEIKNNLATVSSRSKRFNESVIISLATLFLYVAFRMNSMR